jgi:hypothetical protein
MSTQLIVALALVSVIKAGLTYLRWYQRQKWRTRRLKLALHGVEQEYRENVIRACGELENGGNDGRD